MIDARPSRAPSRRPAGSRAVYTHHLYGLISSLKDPAIDFAAVAGVASPDGADLEGRLERFMHGYWEWQKSGASKLDPWWLQSRTLTISRYDVRETMRHKGEHRDGPGLLAELETAVVAPPILRFEQVVDRLITNGDLSPNHLLMLELRWRRGMELERPDEARPVGAFTGRRHPARKLDQAEADEIRRRRAAGESVRALARAYSDDQRRVGVRAIIDICEGRTYRAIDPDQTVAGQLQVTNARVRRMWAEATVRLWFNIWPS